MYEVINNFRDLQDNGRPYKVGDTFPHDGRKITKARLNILMGKNPYGTAFVKEVLPKED